MAFLQRLGRAYRSFFDNPAAWNQLGISTRMPAAAGVPMDEETCLTHLPVYAAINRIATDMSLLDIQLDKREPNGGRTPATDLGLYKVLTWSVDGIRPTRRWVQATLGHLLTYGNSYSEIEFSNNLETLGAHLLDPRHLTPQIDGETGELVYKYQAPGRAAVTFPAWKILHFAGLGHDGIRGYSPIGMARETLAIGRAADIFGAAFFGNAARPGGFIKHPAKLSDNAKKNLVESFQKAQGGLMNVGHTGILEEGMEWVAATIPPDEAQFLETRKASIEDIARLYGMHASKIGGPIEGGSLEERNQDYLQTTLLGWCSVLEAEIELKCLTPDQQGRYKVRFDFEPLLRPNAVARASYASILIDRGVASPNDIAAREGFRTYKGGDVRYRPLNMAAIDPDTGEIILPPTPAPAPPAPSFSATDPNTDQQAGIPNKASVDAVAQVVRAELSRALRREVQTVRRAAGKPGFVDALAAIYSDHENYLAETLAPSVRALATVSGKRLDAGAIARAWVAESRSQLQELEAVTTSDQRPDAVEALATTWEARVARVVDTA